MRLSAATFLCVLLCSLSAVAQPTISWSAPTECPSAREAALEIARFVRRPLSEIDGAISVNVRILRSSATQFEARITIAERSGERVLRDPRCAVLSRAAAVIVALAIDPAVASSDLELARPHDPAIDQVPAASEADARAVEKQPAAPSFTGADSDGSSSLTRARVNSATPARSPAVEPLAPPARLSAGHASWRDLRGYVAGSAALAFGTLPGPAAGPALAVGALGRLFRAGVRLAYFPGRLATLREAAGVGGRVGQLALAVEGGLRLRFSRFEVPIMGLFESGLLLARGVHVAAPRSEHRLWLGAGLASGLSFLWRELLALGLRVEGLVALRRPRFAVFDNTDDAHVFHRPGPLAGRIYFELELRFP